MQMVDNSLNFISDNVNISNNKYHHDFMNLANSLVPPITKVPFNLSHFEEMFFIIKNSWKSTSF